jgi:pimeloyl-ACP methyl ester carboxylesterase
MTTPMWDYQMIAFADHGYHCVAFDRRGHGQSGRPIGGYDYDTFADDAAAVITALARMVMLAPTTPYLLKTADNPNGVPQPAFEALRASWRKDYQSWVADNSLPFFVPETSPSMIQWVAGILTQCPVQIAIACNIAMTTTDFRRDLARISVPTLVIHGDRDVSAPLALTGRPTAALIAGSRLKVYEGAPHGLMYTHMQMLTDDILQFIRET